MAVGAGELGGESNDGIHRGAVRHDAVYAILLPAVQQLLPVDEFAGDIAGDDCHDAGLRATDGRMDTGSCLDIGNTIGWAGLGAKQCNNLDRTVTRSSNYIIEGCQGLCEYTPRRPDFPQSRLQCSCAPCAELLSLRGTHRFNALRGRQPI